MTHTPMNTPHEPANPPLAAFAIAKGPREVLFLSERDVSDALDPATLLDELQRGFADLARGVVQSPHRPEIIVPGGGFSLAMTAWRPGDLISVKVVNVFDGNLELGLPNHLAMITLFDPATGATRCVMDGTYITAVRTAGAAALSVRLSSRPEARVATIVGAGVQAREHLRFLPLVRDIERINICALTLDDAQQLAGLDPRAVGRSDIACAVAESDIICLATHSAEPVIDVDWVSPGTHVTSVGYHPPAGELPRTLLTRGRLLVESDMAFAPVPSGCAELVDVDPSTASTLGDVVLGIRPARQDEHEITIYKAMGIAMQDMVAANLAYRSAVVAGRGTSVVW